MAIKKDFGSIDIMEFGAKGNGVNDDTVAIQSAISYVKSQGGGTIEFPIGQFKFTDTIIIDSNNINIVGANEGGTVLKYVGEGKDIKLISLVGIDANNPVQNINIKNLTIDATSQVNKGGNSDSDLSLTSPNPKYKGATGISAIFSTNISISNCTLNDIYGNGIIFQRSSFISIIDNQLFNCGGSNVGSSSPTGYDTFGDGIASLYGHNITVRDNMIMNTRNFKTRESVNGNDPYGSPCARNGLLFQYAINDGYANDVNSWPDDPLYNAPYYSNFSVKNEFAVVFDNNYVYGYVNGIHLESDVRAKVQNNNLVRCPVGIMFSGGDGTIFSGNYFDSAYVGRANQVEYNKYYCGIAISQYGTKGTKDLSIKGVEIIGNSFFGDSDGIRIARPYAVIANNEFKNTGYCIYTLDSEAAADNVVVKGNTFNKDGFMIYNSRAKNWIIDGNLFLAQTNYGQLILESSYTQLSNNILESVFIYISGTVEGCKIIGNNVTLYNGYNQSSVISFNQPAHFVMRDNNFILSNFNIPAVNFSGKPLRGTIDNNLFDVTGPNTGIIKFAAAANNIKLTNNKVKATNDANTLISHTGDLEDCEISNNLMTPSNSSYVYNQTTGGNVGVQEVSRNVGIVKFSGSLVLPTASAAYRGRTVLIPGINGEYEVATLTINSGCTTDGNVTINLDGIAKTVSLTTSDSTSTFVAAKIRATSFNGWITGGSANVVTFTATTSGDKINTTYSAGSTGASGTVTTNTQGVNSVEDKVYICKKIANDSYSWIEI